jgi:hypothetical protein
VHKIFFQYPSGRKVIRRRKRKREKEREKRKRKEEEKRGREKNNELSGHYVCHATCLQRRTDSTRTSLGPKQEVEDEEG